MIVTETTIRVRYADTDQMKMAYYGKFFEYFEQGRSDLLREIGLPYPEIEQMGYYLPVAEAHAKYLKPARYDDALIVRVVLKDIPQVRVRIEYEVLHAGTKELLAEGYTIHSFISASTGKPVRAPDRFLELVGEAFQKHRKRGASSV
jgi:acyl-CoA thioester hydrolase